MIIKLLCDLILSVLSVLLSPFSLIDNFIFNVFGDSKFISLLKVLTFFFSRTTILAIISTFIFWTSIFVIKPLVTFIRNRS